MPFLIFILYSLSSSRYRRGGRRLGAVLPVLTLWLNLVLRVLRLWRNRVSCLMGLRKWWKHLSGDVLDYALGSWARGERVYAVTLTLL
ncbi:hypothetical protein BU26DRAFT_107344 [Trematosphaeria pertusa]|uniref:Uncharacterized protein n=1 Tax=Trematosphaeria pertusa TaxID=390896 RepID=A0A6A6I095_9PLEO|nr:uncharacterized protein BU26DRAFT_107344 [Trematosphaeria pertusa]KAF2243706.1 hypothetical protein BU26DRAFT_107344 [Trematosphaeria pertusa]